jgi:hypothetical protein
MYYTPINIIFIRRSRIFSYTGIEGKDNLYIIYIFSQTIYKAAPDVRSDIRDCC